MRKKIIYTILLLIGNTLPSFATVTKGDSTTTTTTTIYYGSKASNSKNNPCAGSCDAICKKVVVTSSETEGGGSKVSVVTIDSKGHIKTIDTQYDRAHHRNQPRN